MDLYAYMIKEEDLINKYIEDNYGKVPRNRGVRFMKVETKVENPECEEEQIFNKYVGTDTIYIHTRCGNCGSGYRSKYSNYVAYGAKEWEKSHKDLFLEHITEAFDNTYCTHYFKAKTNDDYAKIISLLTHQHEDKGE